MNMDVVGRIKCIDNNGWDEFVEGSTYTVYFSPVGGNYIKLRGKQISMDEVEDKIYYKCISGRVD